ncbi:SdiA-regulated domain-containing protein [Flavobacterium soyangense]|uniref:SdiA-regulated domain-containing protein n=1 Tax=Flavobacterium soyangense TaxID=2023265 RepID=A0A930UCB3_9FLAO|nr:SdiA-regulated domain-containing protein [Flavobacterium soyangense]MBF2709445.1 SdiA-regulated domain-containing protein [Flavobacterium soyangense]
MNKLLSVFLVIFLLISCNKKQKSNFNVCSYYQLQKPDEIWEMPIELKEISGIVKLDNQKIIGENDEEGKLFIYDLKNKLIEKTILFAKKGDYEDIAINEETAYILRSDGIIFEIKDYKTEPKTTKHHTFLSKDDDTEGMFFDEENNRLLIACKGNSGVVNEKKVVLVYEFVLDNNSLNPKPIISISQKDIRTKYKNTNNFAPSGIAIHPITKNIFVITSVGKMMAEYSPQGKLLHVFDLDYPYFQQPEGISFSQNGDLYISNEAKGSKANILRFKYLL